jgi:hypothetical protein
MQTTIGSDFLKLELDQKDLNIVRVQYCDKNGNVIDSPTLFELACKYASKYGIRFDHVKVDSIIPGQKI